MKKIIVTITLLLSFSGYTAELSNIEKQSIKTAIKVLKKQLCASTDEECSSVQVKCDCTILTHPDRHTQGNAFGSGYNLSLAQDDANSFCVNKINMHTSAVNCEVVR